MSALDQATFSDASTSSFLGMEDLSTGRSSGLITSQVRASFSNKIPVLVDDAHPFFFVQGSRISRSRTSRKMGEETRFQEARSKLLLGMDEKVRASSLPSLWTESSTDGLFR